MAGVTVSAPLRHLRHARRVHCVGVAGSGMSSLALLLRARGLHVSGCDVGAAPPALSAAGVAVARGHAPQHLDGVDLVVRSAAVRPDSPELAAAVRRGLPVLTHAQALGALMAERVGLAVAGTHGKTTTTALLAWILARAGLDPTLALGGESLDFGASGRLGSGPYLVAEADEYDRRFLELRPRLAILTNIEPDHLDYYRDLGEIVAAFRAFVDGVAADGLVVTCADAPLLDGLDLPRERLRYGFAAHSDWLIDHYLAQPGGGCRFAARAPDGAWLELELRLSGRHNASNATAALAAARWVGVEPDVARAALADFRGTRRRFEHKGARDGVLVVDDYAHHPTELRATLAAARAAHPGRIVAVFQPHTTHRTAALLGDFAAAFGDADCVLLLPIYQPPGRESDPAAVRSEDLARAMAVAAVEVADSLDDALARLRHTARAGDLVLTLGAGDVFLVGERLLAGDDAR